MSLVLVLAMCVSALGVAASAANYDSYKDADTVKTDYAQNETAIDVVTGLGIINGIDGSLKLGNNLTRAEAAKILTVVDSGVKAAEATNSSTVSTGYTDMKGHWGSGYVAYCTAKNFLVGVGGGKFEPEEKLTGYAFGKMLLNVLGVGIKTVHIDGTTTTVNDYTGSLWEAKVLADATELGLFDKVESNPSSAINRADAMQMVYNALRVNANPSDPTYQNKLGNVGNDVAKEFALTYVTTSTDVFGRPKTVVNNSRGNKITAYEDTPVLTYTKGVEGEQIWKDLDKPDTPVVEKSITDGKDDTRADTIGKGVNASIGGNGILTEVYKVMDGTTEKYRIVKINEYIDEISAFQPGMPGEKNVITVDGMNFETDAYSKADIDTKVIYTQAWNSTKNEYAIQTVATAENFSGKPTQAKVSTMPGNVKVYTTVVDGTTYNYHDGVDNDDSKTAAENGLEMTYYMDSYGNVIEESEVDPIVNYAVVVKALNGAESLDGTTYATRLLMPDGTTIDVHTKDAATGFVNDIVSYSVKDDVYTLTQVKADAKGTALAANSVTQTIGNESVKVNSKTVFLFADQNPDKSYKYTVYTGTANLPTLDGTKNTNTPSAAVANNGYAELVYVLRPVYQDAKVNSIIYIPAGGTEVTDEDGTYNVLDIYVDGEIQKDVKVATGTTRSTIGKDYKTEKGIITSVSPLPASEGNYTTATVTGVSTMNYANGVVSIGSTELVATEDVLIYVEGGNFEGKSIKDADSIIKAGESKNVTYYTYDGVVKAIFVANPPASNP